MATGGTVDMMAEGWGVVMAAREMELQGASRYGQNGWTMWDTVSCANCLASPSLLRVHSQNVN